jgi:phage tail protein X
VRFALICLAANLASLACVIGAILLAHAGIAGWGWFLAVGLLLSSSPSKSTPTQPTSTETPNG